MRSEEWRVKSGIFAAFTYIFQFIAEGDTFTPHSTLYTQHSKLHTLYRYRAGPKDVGRLPVRVTNCQRRLAAKKGLEIYAKMCYHMM